MTIKNTNTQLLSGTVIEFQDPTNNNWYFLPRVVDPGASGEMAEPKEKTSIEDTAKTYGVGLRDAPDKNLQGQVIPPQDPDTGEYILERENQQRFFTLARNETEFPIRITYPDLQRCLVTRWQSLGFQIDAGTSDGWKMFTVNGKQNSRPVWTTATELESLTVVDTLSLTVGDESTITVTPEPVGAYYVPARYFISSNEGVATVSSAGKVVAVAEGNAMITCALGNQGVESQVTVTVTAA